MGNLERETQGGLVRMNCPSSEKCSVLRALLALPDAEGSIYSGLELHRDVAEFLKNLSKRFEACLQCKQRLETSK